MNNKTQTEENGINPADTIRYILTLWYVLSERTWDLTSSPNGPIKILPEINIGKRLLATKFLMDEPNTKTIEKIDRQIAGITSTVQNLYLLVSNNIFIYKIYPYILELANTIKESQKKNNSLEDVRVKLQEIYQEFLGLDQYFIEWFEKETSNKIKINQHRIKKIIESKKIKTDYMMLACEMLNHMFPEDRHLSEPTIRKKIQFFERTFDKMQNPSLSKDENNQLIRNAFRNLIDQYSLFNPVNPNLAIVSLELIQFILSQLGLKNENVEQVTDLIEKMLRETSVNIHKAALNDIANSLNKESRHKKIAKK